MNLGQGKSLNMDSQELINRLKTRFSIAFDNLQRYTNETVGNTDLRVLSYYDLEQTLEKQNGDSYKQRWDFIRNQVILENQDPQNNDVKRILYNSIRTNLTQQGLPKRQAAERAKLELSENYETQYPISFEELIDLLPPNVLEFGLTWEIEYRINGLDFEELFPKSILIQNETESNIKIQLYNKYRKSLLPQIARVL